MKKYEPSKKCIVMSRDEVRAFDAWAINELLIPGIVLMENAGRSCAELVKYQLKKANACVCIFCGTGNNGGDGFVIARHLINASMKVKVMICGDSSKIKGDAKTNLDVLREMGQPVDELNLSDSNLDSRINIFTGGVDIIVDAIFGTGLNGQLNEDYIRLIECINSQGTRILAVDIPSGLDCDTGHPLGASIKADWTITFAVMKKGFVFDGESSQYTGEIWIASIGIEPEFKRF